MSNSGFIEPPPPTTNFPVAAAPAAQANMPALISFITSLLVIPLIPAMGVGFALPIAAVVLGHIGLRRARTLPPTQSRRWMALTGVILGYSYLALFVSVAGLFLILSMTAKTTP